MSAYYHVLQIDPLMLLTYFDEIKKDKVPRGNKFYNLNNSVRSLNGCADINIENVVFMQYCLNDEEHNKERVYAFVIIDEVIMPTIKHEKWHSKSNDKKMYLMGNNMLLHDKICEDEIKNKKEYEQNENSKVKIVVHHKKNTFDNRKVNLEVITDKEHGAIPAEENGRILRLNVDRNDKMIELMSFL